MAEGAVTIFNEFRLELGKETHNLSSDTIKLGLVTSAVTPGSA